MKNLLPVLLCGVALTVATAVVTTARAGSVQDLDQHNGLPDAQLGASVSSFRNLQQTEDTGRWTSYRRPTDRLTFGPYDLSSITYNFFKGKLYSIFLETDGKRNVKGVLNTLERMYGKDHTFQRQEVPKINVALETREWTGTKVYLLYKNGDDYRGGQITILDKPTWDALQKPKLERTAELRKMLEGSFTNGDF